MKKSWYFPAVFQFLFLTAIFTQPLMLKAQCDPPVVSQNPPCFSPVGESSGLPISWTITLSVSDDYESYSWNGGISTTNSFTFYCYGWECIASFTVTVTDANGCTASTNYTIQPNSGTVPLTVSATSTCPDNIILTASSNSVTWHMLNDILLPNPIPFATGNPLILSYGYNHNSNILAKVENGCMDAETIIYLSNMSFNTQSWPFDVESLLDTVSVFNVPNSFCQGTTVTIESLNYSTLLNSLGFAPTYGWDIFFDKDSGGSTYISLGSTITEPGTLVFNLHTMLGCNLSQTHYIAMIPVETPVMEVDTLEGCSSCCTIINTGGDFSSYLWSTGETTNEINVCNYGTYSVTVTNSEGCSATNSVDIGDITGFDDPMDLPAIPLSDFDAIPNGKQLNLHFSLPMGGSLRAELYALNGQLVTTKTALLSTGNHLLQVPIVDVPTGIYLVVLVFKGQIFAQKVMIAQ